MKLKVLGYGGLAVAGVLVAIAVTKKLVILGIVGLAIYYFAIRPFRRSSQEEGGQ